MKKNHYVGSIIVFDNIKLDQEFKVILNIMALSKQVYPETLDPKICLFLEELLSVKKRLFFQPTQEQIEESLEGAGILCLIKEYDESLPYETRIRQLLKENNTKLTQISQDKEKRKKDMTPKIFGNSTVHSGLKYNKNEEGNIDYIFSLKGKTQKKKTADLIECLKLINGLPDGSFIKHLHYTVDNYIDSTIIVSYPEELYPLPNIVKDGWGGVNMSEFLGGVMEALIIIHDNGWVLGNLMYQLSGLKQSEESFIFKIASPYGFLKIGDSQVDGMNDLGHNSCIINWFGYSPEKALRQTLSTGSDMFQLGMILYMYFMGSSFTFHNNQVYIEFIVKNICCPTDEELENMEKDSSINTNAIDYIVSLKAKFKTNAFKVNGSTSLSKLDKFMLKLIRELLQWDPSKRPTAVEVLKEFNYERAKFDSDGPTSVETFNGVSPME